MVTRVNDKTHGTWLSHARTHIQRETKGQKPSKSRDALPNGRRDKRRTTAAADGTCLTAARSIGTLSLASQNMCASSLFLWGHSSQSVFYVYVRGLWYFFTRLLHFTSSKSNRNKARSLPRELWVTNTNFGGRPAEAAVAVKFVHKRIPRQKKTEKTGKCGGVAGW